MGKIKEEKKPILILSIYKFHLKGIAKLFHFSIIP